MATGPICKKESDDVKCEVIRILKRETEFENDNPKGLIQTIAMDPSFPQYSFNKISSIFGALYQGIVRS